MWCFDIAVHNFNDFNYSSFLGASILKLTLSDIKSRIFDIEDSAKQKIRALISSFMMPILAYTDIASLYSISKLGKDPDGMSCDH